MLVGVGAVGAANVPQSHVFGFQVSGVSPATGLKNGRFNRKRNFGNVVSYERGLWPENRPV